MRKKIFYITFTCFCFFFCNCYAKNQQEEFCDAKLVWGDLLRESVISKQSHFNHFLKYDFSGLWMQHQESMLGFTGKNYQRFQIRFTRISKDKSSNYKYIVYGKIKVNGKVTPFSGIIRLKNVYGMTPDEKKERLDAYKEFKSKGKEFDELAEGLKEERFILTSEYIFKTLDHTTIKGRCCSFFYLEKNKILYDDFDKNSDYYSNNLFAGILINPKTKATTVCNFGNYRIPYSGDLDGGAGEFSPDKKYKKNGWDEYIREIIYINNMKRQGKKAEAEKNMEWWR